VDPSEEPLTTAIAQDSSNGDSTRLTPQIGDH
jgi:hypothetical protein